MSGRSISALSDFSWRIAKGLVRDTIFRASWFVLISAPLLAALVANLQAQQMATPPAQQDLASALLYAVDTQNAHLPVNMARTFWASFAIVMATLVFNFIAPARARFDGETAWRDSAAGRLSAAFLKMRHPDFAEPERRARLELQFTEPSGLLGSLLRLPFLLLFFALQATAAVLLFEVVMNVLALVGRSQSPSDLLPHILGQGSAPKV